MYLNLFTNFEALSAKVPEPLALHDAFNYSHSYDSKILALVG